MVSGKLHRSTIRQFNAGDTLFMCDTLSCTTFQSNNMVVKRRSTKHLHINEIIGKAEDGPDIYNGKDKVLTYSLLSAGPGADPDVPIMDANLFHDHVT